MFRQKTMNITQPRRNIHTRTRGTKHEQLSTNAEGEQFPHPQLLMPDDHFCRNMW
jgi:hypothetical protein